MNRLEIKYLLLCFVIFIAACVETDIFLPAVADMMAYFQVSEDQIQGLLSWNFLGMCLSGPFYGPLSDAYGRKKPLLIALGLFLAGCLLTLMAHNFNVMLWGRILQGLGTGGCFTLGTAIIFDAFQGDQAIRAINRLSGMIPFVMAFAPMVGGYLNQFYGFRSNFIAIGLLVLLSLLICLTSFDETLPVAKRKSLQAEKVVKDFSRVFSSIPLWQLTLIVSLLFAGFMVFVSGTSVLYVVDFGIKKEHLPLYQVSTLISWLVGNMTMGKALRRLGPLKVKQIGCFLVALGTAALAGVAWATPQSAALLTGSMVIYMFGFNWAQGLYFPEAMELLPDIKGVTASVFTSARLLITAFIIALASRYYDATIYPLLAVELVLTVTVLILVMFYERRQPSSVESPRPASQSHNHL